LGACLYDSVLIAALMILFTAGALFFTHGHALLWENVGAWVYLYRAGLLCLIGGYFVLNWASCGQTLGMRAWRLTLVSEAGKPIGAAAALLRFACAWLAWAPAALGVLWLYLDSEHLAVHDRWSRTRVIHLARSADGGRRAQRDDRRGQPADERRIHAE
jgi:uncharacterized RDD family membrane protein YckC